MNNNADKALKQLNSYLNIIKLLDRQITEVEELAKIILQEDQIICFHLHTDMLYMEEAKEPGVDTYEDYVNPDAGINVKGITFIMPGQMMNPQEIQSMLREKQGNLKPGSRVVSKELKLNTAISISVLQVILDGFKTKRQEIMDKIAQLNIFRPEICLPASQTIVIDPDHDHGI